MVGVTKHGLAKMDTEPRKPHTNNVSLHVGKINEFLESGRVESDSKKEFPSEPYLQLKYKDKVTLLRQTPENLLHA